MVTFFSWLEIPLIKALRNPTRGTNGIRPVQGPWHTMIRTPIVGNERLPKDTAGGGLTSTVRPPNL